MSKTDATRRAIATIDEAIGREHEAGRDGKDLKVLRAVINSTVPMAIKNTLKRVDDKDVIDAVEALLLTFR